MVSIAGLGEELWIGFETSLMYFRLDNYGNNWYKISQISGSFCLGSLTLCCDWTIVLPIANAKPISC